MKTPFTWALILVVSSFLLVGCGGGGESDETAPAEPPAKEGSGN
jgi:hypothetical protein